MKKPGILEDAGVDDPQAHRSVDAEIARQNASGFLRADRAGARGVMAPGVTPDEIPERLGTAEFCARRILRRQNSPDFRRHPPHPLHAFDHGVEVLAARIGSLLEAAKVDRRRIARIGRNMRRTRPPRLLVCALSTAKVKSLQTGADNVGIAGEIAGRIASARPIAKRSGSDPRARAALQRRVNATAAPFDAYMPAPSRHARYAGSPTAKSTPARQAPGNDGRGGRPPPRSDPEGFARRRRARRAPRSRALRVPRAARIPRASGAEAC